MTTAPRLPIYIEQGAKYTPTLKVSRHRAKSGLIQAVDEWDACLASFDIGYGIREFADFEDAEKIFKCYRGVPFRFKNWKDYLVTLGNLGVGDGTTRDFLLRSKVSIGNRTYYHPIYAPIASTILAYVDGTPTSAWQLIHGDADTVPRIRFNTPPANTKIVTATFEFDVPVIWGTDLANISISTARLANLSGIMLLEVLQNPDAYGVSDDDWFYAGDESPADPPV